MRVLGIWEYSGKLGGAATYQEIYKYFNILTTIMTVGFPGGLISKESACDIGDLGSIPGLERSPGGGHSNPLQYSCLENPHGQRSLVGYSPWGHKESDTTERLSTAHDCTSWTSVLHVLLSLGNC